MIFSILQISRDHFANLSSVVYCKKGHCLETVKLNGCTRVRDHSTAVISFVQKRWLTGFTVTLVVTYSETHSEKFMKMQVYDRKLYFQANLCEVFAEDKQQHYCGDLVLGWAVLQRLSSTISKQDFHQTFWEVLT